MPNNRKGRPTEGLFEIELDKKRLMKFDFNTLADAETMTGTNLLAGLSNPSAGEIRAILWASLLHEDPALQLRDVGSMMTFDKLEYITERVTAGLTASLPDSGDDGPLEGQAGS